MFNATAICQFGDLAMWEDTKVTLSMNVAAVGKYSHIFVDGQQTWFDFGSVFVGKAAEKSFTLRNDSSVSLAVDKGSRVMSLGPRHV